MLRTGKSLLCDKATDEELQKQGEVELIGASSPVWLGVPLIVENNTIGVMTVQHYSDPHAYGKREQNMLEYVSSQVAKAIERKSTEASLRQNEERLRTFVTNAPMVLFAVDQQGIFTLSEGLGLASLNLKPGQVVGQSVFEVYKDYPKIVSTIRRALAGESLTATVEVDQLVFESHFTPIRAEDGRVSGVIGVASNISERRQAEQLQTAVYGISQAADGSRTLDDLFERVHEIVSSVMPARNFYIALYEESQQMISFPYFLDEIDVEAPPQNVGKGLTEYVLRTGTSLLCDDKVLNELIAYLEMAKLPADGLDPRSRLIMLYAMCGFANFGSLGIMIAGLATMCPERREHVGFVFQFKTSNDLITKRFFSKVKVEIFYITR